MNNKKFIKFGIIYCSIIVLILLFSFLFLIFFSYNKKPAKAEQHSNISDVNNTTEENKQINIEKDIQVDTETLKNLVDKINFPTYATASLYNVKSFDLNTIPNDLILRLGWSKINIHDESVSLYRNNDEVIQTQTVPKNTLYQKISNIFGTNIQYEDSSFINDNISTFNNIVDNPGSINYSNDIYTASYVASSGGTSPFIHQEIEKVIKSDNTVKLYVKTAYVDLKYSDDLMGYYYYIYKDFNFESNTFENFIKKIADNSFFEFSSANDLPGIISLNANQGIYKISNKLNTYVYTFEYNENNKDYYLSSFDMLNN